MSEEITKEDSYTGKVVDHVSAMLAYWDKDQICRFANAAYLDWFGKTREEMINKIHGKELLGPLYEKNIPYVEGALRGETQVFERDVYLQDGTVRHTLATYYPDFENGVVNGFYVHVADVSFIKRLEKEFIKSNEKVIEQNKRLMNFAYIVSHNLKSYAHNLDSMLMLFLDSDSDALKAEIMDHLVGISKGFNTTIGYLSDIVKSHTSIDSVLESLKLYDFIERSIQAIGIGRSNATAEIINNVSPETIILAIPAYIESILLNFLTNAIKYKHPDRKAIIEFKSFKQDHEIVLQIIDNGIGIDLEKHGKELFGMYQTFNGNPDAQGIGLYITRNQIEEMGARVEVESTVGEGTTFSIYFKGMESL